MIKKVRNFLHPVIKKTAFNYLSRQRIYKKKGLTIKVFPGVFYPGFVSSGVFLDFLELQNFENKAVLDVGSGTGILTVYAAKRGGKVTATDINPKAIENTRENCKINNVTSSIIESDLFEKIDNQNFDLILVNPPFYAKDPANLNQMAWFAGVNYNYFIRFFETVQKVMQSDSKIWMILNDECDVFKIRQIGSKNGFNFETVFQKKNWGELLMIEQIVH